MGWKEGNALKDTNNRFEAEVPGVGASPPLIITVMVVFCYNEIHYNQFPWDTTMRIKWLD